MVEEKAVKYQTKPVRVEAFQLTEEMAWDYLLNGKPLGYPICFSSANYHAGTRTMNHFRASAGGQRMQIGDWAVVEPGLVRVVKAEEFAETYEPVEGQES
jgi:hypothetical protein